MVTGYSHQLFCWQWGKDLTGERKDLFLSLILMQCGSFWGLFQGYLVGVINLSQLEFFPVCLRGPYTRLWCKWSLMGQLQGKLLVGSRSNTAGSVFGCNKTHFWHHQSLFYIIFYHSKLQFLSFGKTKFLNFLCHRSSVFPISEILRASSFLNAFSTAPVLKTHV